MDHRKTAHTQLSLENRREIGLRMSNRDRLRIAQLASERDERLRALAEEQDRRRPAAIDRAFGALLRKERLNYVRAFTAMENDRYPDLRAKAQEQVAAVEQRERHQLTRRYNGAIDLIYTSFLAERPVARMWDGTPVRHLGQDRSRDGGRGR